MDSNDKSFKKMDMVHKIAISDIFIPTVAYELRLGCLVGSLGLIQLDADIQCCKITDLCDLHPATRVPN